MIGTVENESGKKILIIDNFEHQPPYQVMDKECPGLAKIPYKITEQKICFFFSKPNHKASG